MILYLSQEDKLSLSCLHIDFECFKLALWPTLRQKFMNFLNLFDLSWRLKQDEEISNSSSTPQAGPSWCLGKYHSEMKCFLIE